MHERVAYREVGGQAFLVTTDRAMHRVRAASGVAIVKALREGPLTLAELTRRMQSAFRGDPDEIAATTAAFVAQLAGKGIVVREPAAANEPPP